MSKKYLYVGADGLDYEALAYESTDFATAGGAGNENAPVLLDGSGLIPSTAINESAIDHGGISGLGDDDHTIYTLATGARAFSGKQSYSSAFTLSADTELTHKKYVDDLIASTLASEMTYKGVIDTDTPSPDLNAIDNYKGDMYKVSVAGTYLGQTWDVGDMLIVNKEVLSAATIVAADVDKVDNTESTDLLRETDLASTQIFVGDGTGTAQAVSMSGDVTLSNTGVAAIGSGVIVNADINASAAIALSKLAAGTDGYIIVANGSGVPTYVDMSGDVTISNAGVATIGADKVKDSMIDWGIGAGQVDAGDLPITDAGAYTSEGFVEGAIQELYGLLGENGQSYTVGTGGVTKGDPVYISADNTVLPYTTISVSERVIGIALSTVAAAGTVKVLANDTQVSGLTFADTPAAGDPLYWNGTAHSKLIPATTGAFVWQTGVMAASGVLHVENRFVKKNA